MPAVRSFLKDHFTVLFEVAPGFATPSVIQSWGVSYEFCRTTYRTALGRWI